jgi:hypothetical protein
MAEPPKNRKRFWWRLVIFSAIAIGVLAALLPNFVVCGGPAGYRTACANNLLQINGAKEQWARDNKAEPGTPVIEAEVAEYMKHGMPECPRGGRYTIGKVGELAHCSIPDHVLPFK